MQIKEYNQGSDYVVEIRCCAESGDRARIISRNNNRKDVPLVVYNVGPDFNRRSQDDQCTRLKGFLKVVRLAVEEVVKDLGEKVWGRED
jgi:hypothetical protein